MNNFISFKDKDYKEIKLNISSKAGFNEILEILYSIKLKGIKQNSEHVTYALLELLNNSLRAHREKSIDRDIVTTFSTENNHLLITIQDWGGGFDTSKLPYDINESINKINLNDSNFQDYRKKHDFLRFGMGLYLAKKTFVSFKLSFFDNNGTLIEWNPEKTAGTIIELKLELVS